MNFTGTLLDLDDQKSMEHILQFAIRRTCSLWNGMFVLSLVLRRDIQLILGGHGWYLNVPPGKYLLNDHVSKWP